MKKYTPFERIAIQLGRGATLTHTMDWRTHRIICTLDSGDKVNTGTFDALQRHRWIERAGEIDIDQRRGQTSIQYKLTESGAQRVAGLVEQHERFETRGRGHKE